MKKHCIFFLLTILLSRGSYGQKLGEYYVSISSNNAINTQSDRIRFLSDSTIELSSTPRHMSPSLIRIRKYTETNSTVEIFSEYIHSGDETKISLSKINRGFIDLNDSLIYVRAKDFDYNPDITFIINGKTYIQDMGFTDGYGLIRKKPKINRKLLKILNTIDKKNCTVEIFRGIAAYQRFGFEKVFGVVVITNK